MVRGGPVVDESLVREVARVLVARVAPSELPTFRVVSGACLADPTRARSRRADAGPLGLGGTEMAVLLLTPVAVNVAKELVEYLMGDVVGRGLARGGARTARAVRRLFGIAERRESDAESPVTLSAEQWTEVRELVVGVVHRAGYADDVAQLLADAVVGTGRWEEGKGREEGKG